MMIIQSLLQLSSMLIFFSLMGLGVTHFKFAKNNLALVPVLGFGAVILLSYIISANFNISGSSSVGFSILILLSSLVFRIKNFPALLKDTWQNKELLFVLAVIAIPTFTVLLPSIFTGFKYFFAYVNYDFFYNSQDSWFLQNHSVNEYKENLISITPLDWSANASGRIAVTLLGAFFSKWLNIPALVFNSLLLNTIVILFALAMGAFCKEIFGLRKKPLLIAVFFSVLSGAYVQAYCCYVLGQISVIPVFIVFCIFLKRLLDSIALQDKKNINKNAIIMALILNTLFVLYAIVSFFALGLTAFSYFICFYKDLKKTLIFIVKTFAITLATFCLVRLLILPESITIIKSWLALSHHVANAAINDSFIVFSEYLTESFLSLFFGLANYVTTNSIFASFGMNELWRIKLLVICGAITLLVTLFLLKNFTARSPKSNAAIVGGLFVIAFFLATYFFFTSAAYGIFKLETWFIPILIPLYVSFLTNKNIYKIQTLLKISCILVLTLNLITGLKYLNDFVKINSPVNFVNVNGITGNKDIYDITQKIHTFPQQQVSLFLTNGMETAWIANLLRTTQLNKVIHNLQILQEKEFVSTQMTPQEQYALLSGYLIIPNPNSQQADIVASPVGGKLLYSNKSYSLIDAQSLQSLIYIGSGAYSVENFNSKDHKFPTKFRWVEKGVEVFIYSNKNKTARFSIEVTPGFVDNKNQDRNITILVNSRAYTFKIKEKTTLDIAKLKLHAGFNRMTIESPDNVSRVARYGALVRSMMPLDPRLTNFAISNVSIT